jgi:hypothetical protein
MPVRAAFGEQRGVGGCAGAFEARQEFGGEQGFHAARRFNG